MTKRGEQLMSNYDQIEAFATRVDTLLNPNEQNCDWQCVNKLVEGFWDHDLNVEWFRDSVEQDADGFFHFKDRKLNFLRKVRASIGMRFLMENVGR